MRVALISTAYDLHGTIHDCVPQTLPGFRAACLADYLPEKSAEFDGEDFTILSRASMELATALASSFALCPGNSPLMLAIRLPGWVPSASPSAVSSLAETCQIRCDGDPCSCPLGTTCNEHTDKGSSWFRYDAD
jgi:hypothetical protein